VSALQEPPSPLSTSQPRLFAAWFPPQPQHWGCSRGVDHWRDGEPLKRRMGIRIRNYAACVEIAGNACISVGLLESRTSPPTLASRRVRVSDRNFDSSGPRITNTVNWRMGGRFLAGSCSRRPDLSCVTPGHECAGIRAPPGRRSQAYPYQGSLP